MDNFFEILVFIVTAIIFIVSAVTKQKKKPNAPQSNVENLLETYFGISDLVETDSTPHYEMEQVQYKKNETNIGEASQIIENEGVSAIPDEEFVEELVEEEGYYFDLKQAVIYSEILQRKEY